MNNSIDNVCISAPKDLEIMIYTLITYIISITGNKSFKVIISLTAQSAKSYCSHHSRPCSRSPGVTFYMQVFHEFIS